MIPGRLKTKKVMLLFTNNSLIQETKKMINIKTCKLIMTSLFINVVKILIILSTGYAQEQYLLSANDIAGYTLERQSMMHWAIDEQDKIHFGIGQQWICNDNEIDIGYCQFKNSAEALMGTAYTATKSYATPYIWGSFNGSIVADATWIAIDGRAIFFVRGNIGIKILLSLHFSDNHNQTLTLLSNKLLNKIESNLADEIISFEATIKEKQIPIVDYTAITEAVVNSATMAEYQSHSTWDSKWLFETDSMSPGIRKEWINDKGSIIGIDISQYESNLFALNAGKFQGKNTSSKVFHIDDLDSLKSIISDWQKWCELGFPKELFSVVGYKENVAFHFYQYDSAGIDTNSLYTIVEKLSGQITNF
jgi:hypothetical protein